MGPEIPIWVRVLYTGFVCLLVPVYWRKYGPKNFLWLSDFALLGMVAALWLESSLLASMIAVGTIMLEIFWNLSFFIRLLTGYRLGGLTDYMWNLQYSLFLRSLSLFHVFLPPLVLWAVWWLGYDSRAVVAMTLFGWLLIVATCIAQPEENINWIYGFGARKTTRPLRHILILMLMYPLCVWIPTHLLLGWLFRA